MKSTGEVMGIDRDYSIAFAKSQLGGGTRLPKEGTVFVSVRDADKPRILDTVRLLAGLGFRVLATSGTQRYLSVEGVPAIKINKVAEGRPHIVDAIKNGGVQLVFNTTEGATALADSRSRGAQPSCIKSRTTPLSQGPSPQHRVSRPISGVTSRYVPCKIILRPPLIQDRTRQRDGPCRDRVLAAGLNDASARDLNFVSARMEIESNGQDSDDRGGLCCA